VPESGTAPRKVALAACAGYGPGLDEALRALLAHLGGIGAFVRPGQSVLVKPNLLTDKEPERAVTTHPAVVRALVRLVRQAGGKPLVADSPNSVAKLTKVWEASGFRRMCAEEDVPLLNLEQAGSVAFEKDGCRFSIARPVLDADVIINVPKVKTHVLMTLTAAVKNMYGAVPGYQKTQLHRDHPTVAAFGRLLAAVYRTARPHLSIADGIRGMSGDGPSAGEPVQLGFLAASADAVALDLTLCRILRIEPSAVAYLAVLTDGRLDDPVEIAGETVARVAPASFRTPGAVLPRLIPSAVVRLIRPLVWIRPAFSDRCVGCGRCVRACPAQALRLPAQAPGGANDRPEERRGRVRPELAASACIGCCCCHEVCPENAVSMRPSPLLSIMRRGKPL